MERVKQHRARSPQHSHGRTRSNLSGSQQRQFKEANIEDDILGGAHSTSNFGYITGAPVAQNHIMSTTVRQKSQYSLAGSEMQPAEVQALFEEEKTQRKMEEKEFKVQ